MKSIGIAMFALVLSVGARAYPVDIEYNAKWLVFDGIAVPAGSPQQQVAIGNLHVRELSGRAAGLSAVCGTVDFARDDEGTTDFVVYFAASPEGGIAAIGAPFFYGRTTEGRSIDPEERVAQEACEDAPPAADRITPAFPVPSRAVPAG